MQDLTFFQRLCTFAGLFFASSVAIGDGGGADVVDTGGGGDAVPDDTGGAVETPDETTEETPDEVQLDDNEVAPDAAEARDGRQVPQNVKQALAKLRETDPKAADVVRKAWYEAGDYKQVFPNVAAARDARDTLESLGGSDGIAGLQQEVKDYAGELTRFAEGNPQSIEDFARDFPQGLVKLAPLALDKMRQIDADAYERTASGIVASTLRDKGVAGSVHRLMELISDGKQGPAHELAQKLAQWINGVDEFAKSKPTQTGESPEAKKLREDRAALDREKTNGFRKEVGGQVINLMNESINRALAPMLKGKSLTKEQRSGLISEARTLLSRGFEKNQGYQGRMKALLEQGDVNAISRYVRGQLDANNVLRAVKSAWATRGFATVSKPAATNGNGGSAIAGKPRSEDIDWSKDRSRMRFIGDGINGEATLKNGKVVKFKH